MLNKMICPKCNQVIEEAFVSADGSLWCPFEEEWISQTRDAEHRNGAVLPQQTCPACGGIGKMKILWITLHCSTCHGNGHVCWGGGSSRAPLGVFLKVSNEPNTL